MKMVFHAIPRVSGSGSAFFALSIPIPIPTPMAYGLGLFSEQAEMDLPVQFEMISTLLPGRLLESSQVNAR
jgi:hypothetical protein